MRPVQYFTADYLKKCSGMKPEQIVRFLDDFMRISQVRDPRGSRLISIKVPEALLSSFKSKAGLEGIPYQTQIKRLMRAWLENTAP